MLKNNLISSSTKIKAELEEIALAEISSTTVKRWLIDQGSSNPRQEKL